MAFHRWALLLVLAACAWAPARSAPADEARVQAAYLLNFVRYTRWPEPATGPLVIAVLGTADDAAAVRQIARRAGPVNGRTLEVRLLALATLPPGEREAARALADVAGDAQVLYVGSSHRAWSRVAAAVAVGRPILTVGRGRDFTADGGMFGLFVDRGHLRFAVNAPVIKASQVDVSARLLVLAQPAGGD